MTGRDAPPARASAVVAFARAPRPGEVKTRLAADVGEAAAARLYRAMGRTVVDALRDGPWTLTVAFTPADARAEVEAWLGPGPRYVAQRGEGLGARLEHALGDALRDAASTGRASGELEARACVVGTDAPALGADRVADALDALGGHDLAVGPARDGGYYLLALRVPHPPLFRDVPWGTDRVLSTTLARARELGLSVHLLPELGDVDRVDDVPPGLRHLLEP